MAGEDLVELKFRLADGTDIGPSKYSPATTVASLKEKILAQWPKDKENCPKTTQDVKLINGGKILENNSTLADCTLLVGELPGGVITMHVVLRLPLSDKNNVNDQSMSTYMVINYPQRNNRMILQRKAAVPAPSCSCLMRFLMHFLE
ncbi:membrane-anchored ubiquitin-fold protein 6-like isoform X1 [Gossypium australe]|uniref:Membrane-anchored ubiquitin-fold protein 6-like isoform X1 n=1 Tax=Gossypium australe TaxID=47621 RepID=A0A5B6U995_9ROSI|nr:membrane-anchored ubiquitin-fold protein 6-like isoform X1 [Gossypium australe]